MLCISMFSPHKICARLVKLCIVIFPPFSLTSIRFGGKYVCATLRTMGGISVGGLGMGHKKAIRAIFY